MIRVLVTGSTGGLGANLVAALNQRGVDVIGLRRQSSPSDAVDDLQMTPVTGDVLNLDSLRRAMDGVDWVFHAAAISDDWNYPVEQLYRVNVEGTRNVLQAALEAGVKRFVYTSSTAALGVPPVKREPIDETAQFNIPPENWHYGYSKHLAEQVVQEYVGKGLHATIVLPAAVMGPRDLKFISGQLIARVIKQPFLPFPDGGLNFIDSRDAAAGHIAAAEKGEAGERYILAGHDMTHIESVKRIGEVLGVPVRTVTIPQFVIPPFGKVINILHRLRVNIPIERGRILISREYLYYDNSKAIRELGLQVRPFSESVYSAYRWYVEHNYFERWQIPAHALPSV
jgi:dihydroflavonol-4-reductase